MSSAQLLNCVRLLGVRRIGFSLLILMAFLDVPVFGQVAVWGGGTGVWSNASNWSCFCVPNGGGYSVNIGTGTGIGGISGTVTLDVSASVAGVSLGNGAFGELDAVNSNTLTASNAVIVGASSAGTLNIGSGGVVSDVNGAIGALSSATGASTVSGSGSQWNNSSDLSVGLNGQGTLTISGGGRVSAANGYIGANSGSTGSVVVTGSASQWSTSGFLFVGNEGEGSLAIQNGAVIGDTGNGAVVGYMGAGHATVTGAGSQWNTSGLDVGDYQNGVVIVSNGATVNATEVVVGVTEAGGTLVIESGGVLNSGSVEFDTGLHEGIGNAIVAGHGSQWNNAGSFFVGLQGIDGSLSVEAGAAGTTSSLILGSLGASGITTLTDAGTTWSVGSGGAFIGANGTGTMSVQNEAVLSVSSGLDVGGQGGTTGTGTLTISGGGTVNDASAVVGANAESVGTVLVTDAGSAWNNATSLAIGVGGTGTLTVNNGGLVTAGTLPHPGTITIGISGTVNADGGTLQGTVINHGVLDPLGTVTIKGDYTQGVDGTLILDVAGTGADEFGQLDISGNATFDGTIDFDFINGFAPTQGDSFDFINVLGSADFSGATIDIGGLLPSFDYKDRFRNGQFILTALNDGVSASPTPEPGTLPLLATALLVLLASWHRRRNPMLRA